MTQIVKLLREYYTFKQIPNNFFKPKPKLPTDISKIKTNTIFSYPIDNNIEVARFVQETKHYYRYSISLSNTIITVNLTNKPWLPDNPEQIEDFNLILPIISHKQLVETAQMLRQYYYFIKLSYI